MTVVPGDESNMSRKANESIALIRQAEAGDNTALEEVKRQHAPDHDIWQQLGELAAQVEKVLLDRALDNNDLAKEAVRRKLADMRMELAGSSPTPLDRLLIERIVTCWLQVHTIELFLAQNTSALNIKQAAFHHDRLDRAHRRTLSAMRTLPQARKLL